MIAQCSHLDHIKDVKPRTPEGCEECLKSGSDWVHLRLCLECGHVGCCDDSPKKEGQQPSIERPHPRLRGKEVFSYGAYL